MVLSLHIMHTILFTLKCGGFQTLGLSAAYIFYIFLFLYVYTLHALDCLPHRGPGSQRILSNNLSIETTLDRDRGLGFNTYSYSAIVNPADEGKTPKEILTTWLR